MKKLLVLVCSLLIVGCGSSNDTANSIDNNNNDRRKDLATPGVTGEASEPGLFLVNDLNQTVFDPDSLLGLWETRRDYDFEGNMTQVRMDFSRGQFLATKRCQFEDGVVMFASLSIPGRYRRGEFQLRFSDSETTFAFVNGRDYDCTLRVRASRFQEWRIRNGVYAPNTDGELLKIAN